LLRSMLILSVVLVLCGICWAIYRPHHENVMRYISEFTSEAIQDESPLSQEFVLKNFPPLSQHDPGIFSPRELMLEIDPADGTRVNEFACLATVYVMLERGLGNKAAVITRNSFTGEWNALATRNVSEYEPIRFSTIKTELAKGVPLIAQGTGGGIQSHYVLIVGAELQNENVVSLWAHDPNIGEMVPYKITNGKAYHPIWEGHKLYRMRRIK
jgi:hypothetical protein